MKPPTTFQRPDSQLQSTLIRHPPDFPHHQFLREYVAGCKGEEQWPREQERKGHKKKGPNTRERPLWKVDRCSIFSGCFYSTYFLGYYTLYIIQPNPYTGLPPLDLFYAQAQIICQLPSDSCSWSGRYLFVVANNGNKFQDWVLQRGLTYQILKLVQEGCGRGGQYCFPWLELSDSLCFGRQWRLCGLQKNIYCKNFPSRIWIIACDLLSSYIGQPAALHIVRHPWCLTL